MYSMTQLKTQILVHAFVYSGQLCTVSASAGLPQTFLFTLVALVVLLLQMTQGLALVATRQRLAANQAAPTM